MHYLKIVSKGWAGYNGQLNIITFKDGISTEPVIRRVADRIAACVQVVECDADGNEGAEAVNVGVQHRLIDETASRAPIAKPLATQTEADKQMEARLDAARALTAPIDSLFTREDLEKIADEKGIKGLRDVADAWSVKGRGIPELIEKVLAQQADFLKLRNQKLDQVGGQILKATTRAIDQPEISQAEDVGEDAPEVAGIEGMPAEFKIGEVIVPAATLFESALKNSGRSLTGWNSLRDQDRLILVNKEIAAIEAHYEAKLEPIVPEGEEKADESKEA